MKHLRVIPLFSLVLLFFGSCSGYEQLLKSDDFSLKYQKASEFYNKGSYTRALPLFKQLLAVEKGTPREEELMYYIAYSHYALKDYLIASTIFKNYYTFFPKSNRAVECHYMSAFCFYLASPTPTLDQTVTYKAIESFQLFVNAHPQSDSVQAANRMIDLMRRKLEGKALAAAELYYKTRNYQAAAIAYENLLRDFPDVPQAEYINFLIVDSYYQFAERSITCKQSERYERVNTRYNKFKEQYPQSNFLGQASSLHEQALTKRVKSAEDCTEQERSRALFNAENTFRNKEYEKSSRLFEEYRKQYNGNNDLDQVQLNLIQSRYRLALESTAPCTVLTGLEKAINEYYYFIEEFPASDKVAQAEIIYESILKSQDQYQKNCNELN